MLKRANIQWTAKGLTKSMEKGNINFDNAVQRSLCWDQDRKSLLIHSMIEGYPIPAFYAAKDENGTYSMLDGKQRSNTISEYINSKFALTDNLPEITLDNGDMLDVSGCLIENLPEEAQDRIKDYSLTVYYFEGITDDEISEMFYRLNNGKPLSAIELTRVKAKSIDTIKTLAKHPIFTEATTEKQIQKYTNELIIIQSWAIINKPNISLETKAIRPLIESAEITPCQAEEIKDALTRIQDAHAYITHKFDYVTEETENAAELLEQYKASKKVCKRIFTRTHLISIVPYALQSIEDNVSIDAFAEWLITFYSGNKEVSINDQYNNNYQHGSAKPEAVKARLDALQTHYNNKFIKSNTDTEEEKQTA